MGIPYCHPARAIGSPQAQRGVALIIGLVILVLLALMGTTAYSVATQEDRMAGNARDHARAFEAAEGALRTCQAAINAVPSFSAFTANGSAQVGMYSTLPGGSWRGDGGNLSIFTSPTMPANLLPSTPTPNNVPALSFSPRCIVEAFTPPPWGTPIVPMRAARITATGYGINQNTTVTLTAFVNFYLTD